MAKSTCNPNIELPKGMLRFEVINSTIKDCLGQYCVVGDMAVLDKKTADAYLKKNFIRVALPDFDVPDGDENDPASDDAKTEDDAGTNDGEGTDTAERAAPARTPRVRRR